MAGPHERNQDTLRPTPLRHESSRTPGQRADDSGSVWFGRHLGERSPWPRSPPSRSSPPDALAGSLPVIEGEEPLAAGLCSLTQLQALGLAEPTPLSCHTAPGRDESCALVTTRTMSVCGSGGGGGHTPAGVPRRKRNHWLLLELSGVVQDVFVCILHRELPGTIAHHREQNVKAAPGAGAPEGGGHRALSWRGQVSRTHATAEAGPGPRGLQQHHHQKGSFGPHAGRREPRHPRLRTLLWSSSCLRGGLGSSSC